MNKIYKLVWSKTKNMYVAVCEFAKSHTKPPQTSGISKVVTAGVLASVLSSGVVMPASAAQIPITNNADIDGHSHYLYFIGDVSQIDSNVGDIFGVGKNVTINNGTETTLGEGIVAIGDNIIVSLNNKVANSRSSDSEGTPRIEHVVAIGDDTIVGEENAIALGYQAKARALNTFAGGTNAQALSEGATVLGHNAIVNENSSFAIAVGYESEATGEGANAFGNDAKANSKFSVAFGRGSIADEEASTAIGNHATSYGKRAVAIGNLAIAGVKNNSGGDNIGDDAVAIGSNAKSLTNYNVAIGSGTIASGWGSGDVAIGKNASVGSSDDEYGSGTAIGGGASVQATYGTALGADSSVTSQSGTAIGNGSSVTASNSVALGNASVANVANTVSVGSSSATRKIVNVTAGTANTDASTISQTGNQLALSGNTLSLKTATGTVLNSVTLDSGNTYSAGNGLQLTGTEFSAKAGTNVTVNNNGINVVGNGVIDNGNAGLISGGTLYNEVNVASNGNYIVAGDTTAQNLGALDDAIKDADDSAIKSITANGTTVTYTKGDGTTGTFITQDNNTEYTAGNGLQLNGTEFSAKAGTNVTVDINGINVIGNGTIADGDTGLTSGDTVYDALQSQRGEINTALDGKANVALDNITDAGKTVIKTNAKEAINVVGSGKAIVNKTDVSGVDTYTVGVTVDGSVANGNTGIVDGGTVYNALVAESRPAQDGNYITTANTAGANLTALDTAIKNATDGLDGKANTSLDNITNAGKTVVRDLAKESVKVVNGTNTTVTEGTDGTYKTYAVNVSSNGTVTSGNTGIVTGGTVYDALQIQKGEIEDALDGKANVALDNIIDVGHSVIKTDAKASINVTGGNYATVNKTDVNGVDTYTVNVATDGAVVQGNTKLVTGGTVHSYVSNQINQVVHDVSDALANKANTNMNNLTTEGVARINTIAKGALDFRGSDDVTVDRREHPDYSDIDQVTISLKKDGEVAENNQGVVTGGKIYTAINDTVADAITNYNTNVVQVSLADKANKNLNNLDDNGHGVIKSDAKSAINVVGGTYATVNKTDENGVDTYTVNVATNGVVEENNTNLVTGGTVYNALQNNATEFQDALDLKANKDASNVAANTADWGAAIGTGTVTENNGELVTGGTVYTAITDEATARSDADTALSNRIGTVDADGNYIKTDKNVSENLELLDDAIKDNADAITDLGTNKANVDLDNITVNGKTVVKELAKQSINVVGGTNAEVVKSEVNGQDTYTVNVATDGIVADGDTKPVSGGTVYQYYMSDSRPVADGTYISATNTVGANLTALDNQVSTNATNITNLKDLSNITEAGHTVIKTDAKEAINVISGTYATVDKTDVNGVDTYTVNVDTDGEIERNNAKLVTGGTVHRYVTNQVNELVVNTSYGLASKASRNMDNLSDEGEETINRIAKGAFEFRGTDDVTVDRVTSSEYPDIDVVTISLAKDGQVVENNEGVVTGGVVYSAINDKIADALTNYTTDVVDVSLSDKANKNLNNIDNAGKTVIRNIAKSAVKVADGTNTTVSSDMDDDGNITYKVNTNVNGAVEDGNTGIVSGGVVYDAIQDAISGSGTIEGKANIALDNISNPGKEVIKTNAKEAITVVGSDDVTVTKTSPENVDTYTVSVNKNGAVSDGNTGLITGGAVYTEVRPANGNYVAQTNTTAENLTALDTGLHDISDRMDTAEMDVTDLKDLSNITDNGRTVIRNVAKDAVKVINGIHTTVTEGTDGDAKTYAVNVAVDGAIETGNTGLVSGGAVYDYVQSAIESGVSNVAIADGDNTTVTSSTEGNVTTYRIKANATGTIADDDTGLVDGNTVYDALQDTMTTVNTSINTAKTDVLNTVADDLAGKANVSLDNISADGQFAVKDLATDAVVFENGNHTQVESAVTDHVRTTKVNVVTDGVVAEGDLGIVTGGAVYDALDNAKTVVNDYTDSVFSDAANKSLSNIDDAGKTVLKDSAISAVKLVDGQHTTVGYQDTIDGREYHVDVASDGLIESDNNGLVTGGTVFNALAIYNRNLLDLMGGFLDLKADTDLGNINDSGKAKVRSLAQSAVKVIPGENTNVTVGTDGTYQTYAVDVVANGTVSSESNGVVKGSIVYNEVHTDDGNYISSGNSASQNLTALDNNLKALSDRVDNIPSGGGTDANAVHYDDADKSKVTMEGTDGTVISNVKAGVADSDAATVGQVNDVASSLGARVTLTENLLAGDWEGKTVKQSIDANTSAINNVSDRVTIVENTVSDLQSDVSSLTSTVDSHSDALFSLDTRMGNVENAVNTKASVSLDNIDDAGKTVISDIAKDSVAVGAGDANVNVVKTSDGGKDIYNVSVNTNGIVAEGDTGIVTGGTVYDAIQNIETKQPHYYSVNETHRDETTYNNGGATGEDALAIGIGSKAEGNDSVAIGRSNVVSGYNSTAVGTGQTVAGDRSGAFGDPNTVNGDGSYVIGNDNTVDADKTFVMGSNVTATGENSVVLGDSSDGSQSNVISVGADGHERKIVHVADGVDDMDAVNVRQLKTAKSELEGRVKVTEDLLAGDWGGETVKDKIDKNTDDINTLRDDMGNKANVDASNIDVDKFTDKLGTGDVTEGNNGLVKGGVVYDAIQKIRDTNITLSPDGTTLNVGKGNDASFVDFTNSNGEGRVLQGIVTDPNNPNSAANVGYVDAVGQNIINGVNNGLSKLDSKVNKVGAGAAAMASLAPLPFDEDQRWSVSAAVGTYHGEQAGALGVFYKPADNVMLNVRGSFGNGENMAGAGVTIGLEKKTSAGISKVAMAKAMNAQAQEISMQKEQIAEQQRMLEMQQAQIEQLKRVVQEVVAKK